MAAFVLAGDVGGTKTSLGLFRAEAGELALEREATYPSREFASLDEIVRDFLGRQKGKVEAAAFGLAGPVLGTTVRITNLPWVVDAQSLCESIGCARVRLWNDLQAAAFGILFLPPEKLEPLQRGVSREGNRAVLAAGTGLGQAVLFWDGRSYHPSPTEGGHADFAPRDERESALAAFVRRETGRASVERVLSGPGLYRIFRFVVSELGIEPSQAVLARLEDEDPARVVGESALRGECPASSAAVDLFVSLYGSQAGNLALATFALGGVYVAGGIAGKLLPKLREGGFVAAFRAKDPFEWLLSEIPVFVVLEPHVARLGAAHAAARLLGGEPG
ncbi:MAG: glucokinase [Candidatus Binatia bacterium]|nr:MAG: glucokinase [Candidatus Binatia bacterium]